VSRPTTLLKDNTLYWVIRIYNDSQVLVDADSTPTVAVRKNGASVGDAVTVTKRSATTGIYDCSYNPASEVEGDQFTLEESATVSSQAYENSWSVVVEAAERGTDGANTVSPDNAGITANGAAIAALNDFDPATETVDVGAISGDATAADNLELQYDGTGLDGDSFPARQSQVSDIAVTGAAINSTYDTWTGISGGVVSGTPDSTVARDGVYYQINDAAGIIDQEVEFDIGSDGVPTGVTFYGYLNGGNDAIQLQAYDWNTLQFRTLGTINGNNGSSPFELNFALFTSMVGSGADEGRVIVKFYNATLTNANLYLDQVYCSYAVVNRSVGYSQGAIWVDTLGSNTGAVPFIDGTADNKVNSYANAKTIALAVDLNKYEFSPLNSVTIDQSHAADAFFGSNYALNLNNQPPPTLIQGAEVVGVANGTTSHYIRESRVGTVGTAMTANSGLVCELCGIVNVKLKDQAGAALDVEFLDCHGNTQGSMFPGGSVDFGTTAGTNHEVAFQRWGGPVTLKNLKAGDTVYFHGNGTAILDASCTGGSFRVAGMINLVDNSGGAVSILEDGRITRSGIADSVWDEAIADHLTAGSTGESLNAAGAAGDPWTTTLPGTYTGLQAGKILSDVLEDTGTTLPTAIGNVDTVVDLIKVDTTAILVDTGTTIPAQITALNDPTAAEIADAVWDEPLSAHIGAGSAGIYLLDSGLVAVKLDSALETDGSGGWQYTTLALENAPSGGGGLTVQQIVDGVWDEPQSAHLSAGSFGVYLNSDVSAIRTVVDDTANDVIGIQTTLSSTGVVLTPAERSTVVDLVWDEQTSGHATAGSTGANLIATGQGVVNIETVTDRIDGMLVLNGEGSSYQYTVDALENGPIGSCPTSQEIVDAWGNQPQGVYTTPDTLGFYLDSQVSTAGSGGTGLYQLTVRVQDASTNALQGARINIDGTTLTLTTDSSGEVVFNLDSGIYTLDVSPPAGYDTPLSNIVTINTGDTSSTFTLTETDPGGGEDCDVPWL
jgi:hypothetical protein